jgi:hypothetical protein
MADMIGNMIEYSLPWTLGMSMFYACAQYYKYGGPTPPSKSEWFWTAAMDDGSPHTTDAYVSTLLQTLVPTTTVTSGTTTTITVTPSVPTETRTSTSIATNWRTESLISTMTIKSCTSTVHPFAQTVTQSVSFDITTTETTTIKPTFTKIITEMVQPTRIVYSDSAPPGLFRFNTWFPYTFYLLFAFTLGYCARLRNQLSRFKRSNLYKEHEDKQRVMNEKSNEVIARAKEIKRREKKVERKEQKLQEEISQIKSEADLKAAEASRELNSLEQKLELLGNMIDVDPMSISLEEFEVSLMKRPVSRDREEKDALNSLEKANIVAYSLKKQLDQANDQLKKYGKEAGRPDLEVIIYELREDINTLVADVAELKWKLDKAQLEIKELREGKIRVG